MPAKRKLVFTTPARATTRRRLNTRTASRTIVRAARRFLGKRRSRRSTGRKSIMRRVPFVMYNRLLQHKVRTKLVYCDTKTLAPGSGSARHIFSINNINDPDNSGVGHRPAFNDKWASLYTTYRVTYVRFYITAAPKRQSLHTNVTTASGITPLDQDSHYDQSRNPGIIFWEVGDHGGTGEFTETADLNVIREVRNSNNQGYRMTSANPYKIYKMRGQTAIKSIIDDPEKANASTTFNTNPTNQVYLHVGAMSKDGGPMSDYRFDVRIEFFVEISDLKHAENQN